MRRLRAVCVKIVGTLWTASAATNDTSVWSDGWPKRVEQFDAGRMSEAVGDAMPMEFRLEEDQPGSLEPILLGEEMSSTRHIGYAVQWFAMAIGAGRRVRSSGCATRT